MIIINYCCTRRHLKETEETIVFFVTFLSLVAFQLGGGGRALYPPPWLRLWTNSGWLLRNRLVAEHLNRLTSCVSAKTKRLWLEVESRTQRSRPRTAFSRPRTQPQVFSKKKRSSKKFFGQSPFYRRGQNFWLVGRPKPSITCNDVIKNFQKRNFLWDKDIIGWKIWNRCRLAFNPLVPAVCCAPCKIVITMSGCHLNDNHRISSLVSEILVVKMSTFEDIGRLR